MKSFVISQAVDVHWHLKSAKKLDGTIAGDEMKHTFDNLVSACKFAVSKGEEGNLLIHLYPDTGPSLNLAQAHRIFTMAEAGEIPNAATHVEV